MKIAVLFGGTSSERDVSIASGAQVFKALKSAGHDVIAVDAARGVLAAEEEQALLVAGVAPTPPKRTALQALQDERVQVTQTMSAVDVDVVFMVLHGGAGEDGTIQKLFDLSGITYTGSGSLGSAVAMDKDMAKRVFRGAGIPTAAWQMAPASVEEVEASLGFPCVVKPNAEGSSVGLSIVKEAAQLQPAIQHARQFDREVMIEKFVPGRELTVGILEGRPLEVGEIIPLASDVFDYESKYQVGGAHEVFPAEIPAAIRDEARELALRVHQACKLKDYSRVDFRLTGSGELFVLEVNTAPGMTATSLLPQSAGAMGLNFVQLCQTICDLAVRPAADSA